MLDTRVSGAPNWGFKASHAIEAAVHRHATKPKRSQYPCGAAGQRAFRVARAKWFERKKGVALEGTVAKQVRKADNASRSERVRAAVCATESGRVRAAYSY